MFLYYTLLSVAFSFIFPSSPIIRTFKPLESVIESLELECPNTMVDSEISGVGFVLTFLEWLNGLFFSVLSDFFVALSSFLLIFSSNFLYLNIVCPNYP